MDPSRMRIALASSSYHPHFGGVEEHVRHLAKELQERGHAVEVWTVDRGDGLRDEVVDGCRVRYLPTPLPARSARALASLALRAPVAFARWIGAFASFRPDVINVQCFGPNGVYGSILSRLTRTPLIVSSHGETLMDEHNVYEASALLRWALRRAISVSTVTACSPFVAQDLHDRFGARHTLVVPNGVQARPAPPETSALFRAASTAPVIMGAGRLVPQKGFDALLRAAAESVHAPEVWIVGDGAERPNLENLASSLGIDRRVRFLGRQPATTVQDLMGRADAVVVPSRLEPFGIVVLEAWASGTPVIVTNRGGPAGFVTDGVDGLLVDPNKPDIIAKLIDSVIDNPVMAGRLSASGLDTVKSYSWSSVASAYYRIYWGAGRSASSRHHLPLDDTLEG